MQLPGSEGQPRADVEAEKARLRAELGSNRATRTETPAQNLARTSAALEACSAASVVACYLSRPDEPNTGDLIAALVDRGARVLVPVLRREPDWAWFAGFDDLVPGPHRILQPSGARLGGAALGLADWIWLPGLAGTPDGRRLGTGGGWYDRALGHARPDAVRGMLLFDAEVLPDVPTQPWDQPVGLLVTEHRSIATGVE